MPQEMAGKAMRRRPRSFASRRLERYADSSSGAEASALSYTGPTASRWVRWCQGFSGAAGRGQGRGRQRWSASRRSNVFSATMPVHRGGPWNSTVRTDAA